MTKNEGKIMGIMQTNILAPTENLCQIHVSSNVGVIRFCHHLTVKGKCHHEGEGDIEQERTEKVGSIESG